MPAGQEPPRGDVPSAGDRAGMRKRMRRLRRTREVMLRELGALVVEMQRLGRSNPELVERKASELVVIDEELRGLRAALGERQTVETLVAAGVVGSCSRCASLLGSDDRFCARCGLAAGAVAPRAGAEAPTPSAAAPAEPGAGAAVEAAAGATDAPPSAPAAAPPTPEAAPVAAAADAVPGGGPAATPTSPPGGNGVAQEAAAPPPPPPPPPPPAPELTSSAPRPS